MRILPVPPPPPDPRPFIPTVKILPGKRYEFHILSPEYLGYELHFDGKQTHVCTMQTGHCDHHIPGKNPRWSAFLAVMIPQLHSVRILPITRAAWENCPALQNGNGQLRGYNIRARRLGPLERSALRVEIAEPYPGSEMPNNAPCPDLESALMRLWHVQGIGTMPHGAEGEIPCA